MRKNNNLEVRKRKSNTRRPLMCESLESRTLLSAVLTDTGTLAIYGTPEADTITVKRVGRELVVNVNNEEHRFVKQQVKGGILIKALGGNDKVVLSPNITGQVTIFGGAGNDLLVGSGGADWLYGGVGHDKLKGRAGSDLMFGGPGSDKLVAGAGGDSLAGGAGKDVLIGQAGADKLAGGNQTDKMFGGKGNDILKGGGGSDSIKGQGGDDVLYGGTGDDRLNGGPGNDLIDGDEGEDSIKNGLPVDLETSFEVELQGASGIWGRAEFEVEQEKNGLEIEFELEVAGAPPNSVFDVSIGDVYLGQLVTDAYGAGSLELSNDPDEPNEVALPENLPDFGTHAILLLGDILGNELGVWHEFEAEFSDEASGKEGRIHYYAEQTPDGVELGFELEVEGVAPNSVYEVIVNEVLIGAFTTDEEGYGELGMWLEPGQTAAFPIPDNLAEFGAQVVATLQGILES